MFPLFQFDHDQVRLEVVAVAQLMTSRGADPWTVAAWLCTPDATDPRGRTVIELLRSPPEVERIMQ